MYNEQYKLAFISDLSVMKTSEKQYVTIFNSTEDTEKFLDKDLYDMTFEELELVFSRAKYKRVNSLINYVNTVRSYITWAKHHGYGLTNDNPIIESINEEFVSKYVYNEGIRYFTREELIENMDNLINVQHQAIVLALFEGIRGEGFSEIINLKYDDLEVVNDKYYANLLSDEINLIYRKFEISKELYDLLINTYHKKEILNVDGRVHRVSDGEYIFRKSRSGAGSVKLKSASIHLIIGKYVKDAFNNEVINANYIYNSGMMHRINLLMGDKRVFSKVIADEIIKEYGMSMQKINNKEYPIYANLRRIIDEDFIREAYGDFKMEF